VAGSAERDLFDTLSRPTYQEKITFIQGNSEYPAARMSLGYTRASERVSPLFLHVQFGPANAAMAILDAYLSNLPLLIFTGGHISSINDFREMWYGYARTPELLREYCKHVYRIVDPTNAEQIIQRALRLAETLPFGPVFLTAAQDVIETPLHQKPLQPTCYVTPTPPEQVIYELAERLRTATQPAIITETTRNKASVPFLVDLAEKLGAAVFETRPRTMNFPCSHPLHQGYADDDASSMQQYLDTCDFILSLDCFYPPDTSSTFHVQVSDNPMTFTETANLSVFASTQSFLASLTCKLQEMPRSTQRINALQARHDKIRRQWKCRYGDP
jgi:acetolactate synthase-1/2/3 large subunit